MTDYAGTIDSILSRLKADGYRSWDNYDFWGSRTGISLRRNKNVFTMPILGAAYLLDVVFPMVARIGKKESISMETLPHLMRSMKVYRRLSGSDKYEHDRRQLLEYMVSHLGASEHGKGVGHQFGWYTTTMIPAYTPCVTLSSYLVDYLLDEGADEHADTLRQIGEFVFQDLHLTHNPDGSCKVSYTPLDSRWVVNANSYAYRIMDRLGRHFSRADYTAISEKLLVYVLNNQEEDGGWFYFEKGSVPKKENFIDCFHTAFVLENLMDTDAAAGSRLALALDRGMEYFSGTFVKSNGAVRPFAKSHLPVRIRADIRASAEAMNCLALASLRKPEYREMAVRVCSNVMGTMYDGAGGFFFRDYGFYLSRMNYARWGAVPMLNALCALAEA